MNNKNRIFLSSPHFSERESFYVEKILSQEVSPEENLANFEMDLQIYLGPGSFCAALNSGTAAIHLALLLLGVQRDDEVLCQSFTFSASANPITYVGAKPVFVDSEFETWNMSPEFLETAILDRISKSQKPKAIIVVHLYGMPAQMDEVMEISDKYGIPLIEDAAEALGSTYKGQKCGTFGDFGILSFNGNKIITTSGGGALVCKTQAQKDRAVFLSTQARDNAPHYQHSEIGYNYRMSNICAGIGRGQMEVLEERIVARRKNHDFYADLFKNIDGIKVFSEPDTGFYSNHWLSAVTVDPEKTGFTREDLRLRLMKDNIESRPLWKPMHLQPVFAGAPYYGKNVAEQLFNNGLCLPSGSNLTDEDRERIGDIIFRMY